MASAAAAPAGRDAAIARVGRAVADRRIELGMATQRALAEAAGVALNTAALLERGYTFPRRSNAHKLEKALRWPPGTLAAIRRGEPVPTERGRAAPPALPLSLSSASSGVDAVGIAVAVVNIAAKSMDILLRYGGGAPDTKTALRELDAQLLALETVIAASVDATLSALAQVHRHREALKGTV